LFFDAATSQQQAQLWTSPGNAALLANLRNLILSLGGDASLIAQLFQPGAAFAGSNVDPGLASPAVPIGFIGVTQSDIPEPATMSLLIAALFLIRLWPGIKISSIPKRSITS
jgi:hypothetical protein